MGGTFDGIDGTRNPFGKGDGKADQLFDGGGLYLFVQPNGGRWWRFKYRFHGKERELSLGVYPEVSLKLARARREDARRAVAQGIDPSAERLWPEEMTGHGFRAMASTCLNEQGWSPDLIELQLAHTERNKVRGAYNRSTRLSDRRHMMQAWSDYLDSLRHGAEVINFRQATKQARRTH